MYVPFPSTLKPNLLLAACMYAAFFLAADAFVILSLMFNYFPLLKYCLQSFFSVRKSSAHTSCKNKVFAFWIATIPRIKSVSSWFSFSVFHNMPFKIGGGGENRTRVLKSPQGGFIFNQNPSPPLYLNSRLGIRKVTFFKKSFIQQLFCSNPLVHYLLKFIMFVTSIFRFRFICIISMPTIWSRINKFTRVNLINKSFFL